MSLFWIWYIIGFVGTWIMLKIARSMDPEIKDSKDAWDAILVSSVLSLLSCLGFLVALVITAKIWYKTQTNNGPPKWL